MLDNFPRGTICIEDIEMGMSRHLHKVISDEDIALFAQVSTDHNPVHLDESYARDTIFQGRIAHGMLTAGLRQSRTREAEHTSTEERLSWGQFRCSEARDPRRGRA